MKKLQEWKEKGGGVETNRWVLWVPSYSECPGRKTPAKDPEARNGATGLMMSSGCRREKDIPRSGAQGKKRKERY